MGLGLVSAGLRLGIASSLVGLLAGFRWVMLKNAESLLSTQTKKPAKAIKITAPTRPSDSRLAGDPSSPCSTHVQVFGRLPQVPLKTHGKALQTRKHIRAERQQTRLLYCSPAKSLTFGGSMEKLISWQKVEVLTSWQNATKNTSFLLRSPELWDTLGLAQAASWIDRFELGVYSGP